MTIRRALIALPLCLLPACANHVRYLDVDSDHRENKLRTTSYVIDSDLTTVDRDVVKLKVQKVEISDESSARTTTKYEEVTPYNGLREFWEVPVGVLSLPVAMLLNLADVITFGTIPNDAKDDFTGWAGAAANPFMNPEDHERVEKRAVDTIVKESESKEVRVESPLPGVNVTMHFDDNDGPVLKSDSKGAIGVNVLDVITESLQGRPRKLIVSTPDPQGGSALIQREMYIDRELAVRIFEARNYVLVYKNGPHDPGTLGEAVARLDQLQFKNYSLAMEDKIVNEFGGDEQFLAGFRQTLDQYYVATPPVSAAPVLPTSAPAQTLAP